MNFLNREMQNLLEKLKHEFAKKLVSQERKIVDIYTTQIEQLKEKFEKEFQEKIKKFDKKR